MKNENSPTSFHQFLPWFLGPKGENARQFEELIVQVFRDYAHWRKNYFPADPILINRHLKGLVEKEHDLLGTRLDELMALLRRNFPFYSPRYIAHELSDTLMPATVGYLAGLLFNPNNVTPEAAPVTTELEIEVCSEILRMLGYTPPPELPSDSLDPRKYYNEKSKEGYGWAHLTSGGTVANIEAIWVARQVRYFPLAVKAVSVKLGLDLTIKLPESSKSYAIGDIDDFQLLLIKPNEAIYLFNRFLLSLRRKLGVDYAKDLPERGWDLLNDCELSVGRGTGEIFGKYPPVLLVAGSQHYSVTKAANVLGIGQSNIIKVRTDEYFRLDVNHLKKCIQGVVREKRVPLCVIATAGTTEEGAVDPIHSIVKVRSELERTNISFWLHIDAAWGGFIRSLFCLERVDEIEMAAKRIGRQLGIAGPEISLNRDDLSPMVSWHENLSKRVLEIAGNSTKKPRKADENSTNEIPVAESTGDQLNETEPKLFSSTVKRTLLTMADQLSSGELDSYLQSLFDLPGHFADRLSQPEVTRFKLDTNDLSNWVRDYVSMKVDIGKGISVNYPDGSVVRSFLEFPKANSITVDPHKMGYAPYPAGCVAFQNDRIRSFILQKAPYITAAEQNVLIHLPPRHVEFKKDASNGVRPIITESFSPFILEGSRPGAVAAGLWLAYRTAPLVAKRHGLIVRASMLAARGLYEWIVQWPNWCKLNGIEPDYDIVPLTPRMGDTNLVTFVIKPKNRKSLLKTNSITKLVYDVFAIKAELGDLEYSYNQPFFLSNTTFKHSDYPSACLKPLFKRCGFDRDSVNDYEMDGLVVLRATVMNPYIIASRELVGQDFVRLFMLELHKAATAAFEEMVKPSNKH